MRRYAMVIELKPEMIEQYRALHAAVWPSVLETIRRCNICNYSIFLRTLGERHYLFSYFEYTGADFDTDMAKMGADPETQRWWTLTERCQSPLPDRKPGEFWASMDEVFHAE